MAESRPESEPKSVPAAEIRREVVRDPVIRSEVERPAIEAEPEAPDEETQRFARSQADEINGFRTPPVGETPAGDETPAVKEKVAADYKPAAKIMVVRERQDEPESLGSYIRLQPEDSQVEPEPEVAPDRVAENREEPNVVEPIVAETVIEGVALPDMEIAVVDEDVPEVFELSPIQPPVRKEGPAPEAANVETVDPEPAVPVGLAQKTSPIPRFAEEVPVDDLDPTPEDPAEIAVEAEAGADELFTPEVIQTQEVSTPLEEYAESSLDLAPESVEDEWLLEPPSRSWAEPQAEDQPIAAAEEIRAIMLEAPDRPPEEVFGRLAAYLDYPEEEVRPAMAEGTVETVDAIETSTDTVDPSEDMAGDAEAEPPAGAEIKQAVYAVAELLPTRIKAGPDNHEAPALVLTDETDETTPDMTHRLLALLRAVGYDDPREVLLGLIERRGLEFLLQAVWRLHEIYERVEHARMGKAVIYGIIGPIAESPTFWHASPAVQGV